MRIWENKLQKLLDCPPPTTTTTTTPSPTTTKPPTTTTTQPAGQPYVVPEEFASYDSYDYLTDNPSDDHDMNYLLYYFPNYFDAGDVITLSTRCTNDYEFNDYRCLKHPDSVQSQEAWDNDIRNMCSWYDTALLLSLAMIDPTNPGQYLTLLNCPQCGCTLGQNDAVHIDADRSNIHQGPRSSKKYSEMIPRHLKKSKNVAKGN